jgi:signal peptidase II
VGAGVATSASQPRSPTRARGPALARALGVMLVVLGLDQLTKHTLATSIRPGQVKTVVPGLVHLVHVRNTGVAFGFLSGGGAVVYAVTGLALVALLGYLLARPQRRWLWLPTGMLLGGAIGNLIDRLARGSVIDFIKLPHWPAFNVADTSITLGVVVLVLVIDAARGGHPSP